MLRGIRTMSINDLVIQLVGFLHDLLLTIIFGEIRA